jgi:hypothetical protein
MTEQFITKADSEICDLTNVRTGSFADIRLNGELVWFSAENGRAGGRRPQESPMNCYALLLLLPC